MFDPNNPKRLCAPDSTLHNVGIILLFAFGGTLCGILCIVLGSQAIAGTWWPGDGVNILAVLMAGSLIICGIILAVWLVVSIGLCIRGVYREVQDASLWKKGDTADYGSVMTQV